MAATHVSVVVRDQTPKIGGSSAGFIVLIVLLVVIFIVSTLAIVYLLSDERSRSLTRFTQRRRRRAEQRNAGNSPYAYDPSSDRPIWSWAKRLIPFSRARGVPTDSAADGLSSPKSVPGAHGWYQSSSGDSWDYTTPQLAEVQRLPVGPHQYPASTRTLTTTDLHDHPSSGFSIRRFDNHSPRSSGSVRFEPLDSSKALPMLPPVLSHSGRDSPSSYPALLSSHVFFSSPSPSPPASSPLRSTSQSPRPASTDLPRGSLTLHRTDSPGDEATASTTVPIRTFEGGSRFIEAL